MAVLADLLVRFGADSAELRKTLKTVESDLGRFTRDVKGMKNALAGAFTAVGIGKLSAAFVSLVRGGADAADNIGKMAQKVGISSEDLSRLGYASELAGSNLEGLGTGLRTLSRQMADAAGGSKEAAAAFSAVGVQTKDAQGNLRPMKDVLFDVADRFARMEDGAGKAALAQDLFGRSGLELIPLLNQGSDGLRKLGEEADRYGVTVSGSAAESAEAFNDSLTRLGKTKEGLARLTAERLTPMLEALATQFSETAAKSGALQEAADVLATSVKVLAHVGVTVAAAFQVMGKSVAASLAALTAAVQGNFGEARAALDAGREDVIETLRGTGDRLRAIWQSEGSKAGEAAPEVGKKIAAPLAYGRQEMEKERDRALKTLDGLAADLQTKVATFGQGQRDTLHFRLFSGDLADEVKAAGVTGRLWAATILGAAADLETLERQQDAVKESMAQFNALVGAHTSVWEATRTPVERYREEIARLDLLLEQTVIDQETYDRAVQASGESLANASSMTRQMVGTVVGGFSQMITASGSFADRVDGFFKGLLASFIQMVEEMVARWIAAQIAMAAVNIATAGAGGGGVPVGPVSMPELLPMSLGEGSAFTVPGVNAKRVSFAAASQDTHVQMNITTLDGATLEQYLAKNEGVLARRLQAMSYRRRAT